MTFSPNTISEGAGGVLAGYVTPDVLAACLGISTRTLARWHAMRKGPPRCAIGRLVLYRVEAVNRWLLGQEARRLQGDLNSERRGRR